MEETVITTATTETPINEQAVNTENAEPITEPVKEERKFTQAELDDIVTKRLERDRESTSKKVSQESRDAFIAEQGYQWKGKVIATEAELKQARKESDLEQQYKEKELPEDIVQKLIDAEKFREEAEPLITSLKSEKKQAADFKAFFEAYPDIKAEEVPATVWNEYAAGKDLVDSYAKHENAALKQKLADLEKQKQVEQQNKENTEAATGSVVGQGSAIVANFTREQVAAMSKEEMKVNYPAVVASMRAWKK